MYESFLSAPSGNNWKRIGLDRRAGVAAPLFSVYSKKSIGIGELPDLKLLIDWCRESGLSIIQLLPLNDTGNNFQPYNAESGFALDPMYLSLDSLIDCDINKFKRQINSLRKKFPAGGKRVNYAVKTQKMILLWSIFESTLKKRISFGQFVQKNSYWLDDYAFFKVLSERHSQAAWEDWPVELKEKHLEAVESFCHENSGRIEFYKWLQWQLFHQFSQVRKYGRKKNVLIMGDLPFLAARNSADVWAHSNFFKLDLSSGAPPDAYFANGQRWGSPPCNWEMMERNNYEYIRERLKYTEHFYDLLRIDHVVGLFRLWSIPLSEPLEHGGLNGFFDPSNESQWEARGRKLLSVFLDSGMLACAEDLGTVPECSYRVLAELGIPGIDVQRWSRDVKEPTTFKSETEYRKNSIAMISTHDMTSFSGWWAYEAGTIYEPLFKRQCQGRGINFEWAKPNLFDLKNSSHDRLRWKEEISDVHVLAARLGRPEHEIQDLMNDYAFSYLEQEKFWDYLNMGQPFVKKNFLELANAALEKISSSASIFSIQMLFDWLVLGDLLKDDPWEIRINFPGTISAENWSLVAPVSLEEMKKLAVNKEIKKINQSSGRI